MPTPGSLPATLRRRLLARVIDAVAVLVLGGGLLLGVLLSGSVETEQTLLLAGVVLLVVQAVLQWWVLATRGYTFGRLLTGLRVLTADRGEPLGWGRALLRELVVAAACVVVVGPVFLAVSAARDDRRRGWQDRVARDIVFDVSTGVDPTSAPDTPSQATTRLQALLTESETERRRRRTEPQRVMAPAPEAPEPAAVATTDYPTREAPMSENPPGAGRRVVPPAPYEQVQSSSFRQLDDEVERTRMRHARTKVAYAPTRAQTRPRATLLLWDNRVVVLEGTALVGRNPSPREGEAMPVQVIAVVDRGRSVSKTHLAIGVDGDGVWLRDRNSTNGTVVTLEDGQQILCAPEQKVRVPVGASVAFGDYWLTVAG
ncbi:RDD family protein [Actinotalea sp. M2MS4P-6]|uniref:RDD family protein n=1 Tax=Actinotalea sp. M2MS4P-6 TaxID=2983762 RepID=UPI0021E4B00F|nr:RDD family protein [Actinotalea sp. M2MS4P-6]MCV2395612.1 RDD family protein [Actinotalea sp. M2MS4P-6]